MELLLWMWFYDTRWFFNFKISVKCLKYAWYVPLVINLGLALLCLLIYTPKEDTCAPSLFLWLYSRAAFSFIISLNIIIFLFKISSVYKKERYYFNNARKIYPALNEYMNHYDFWIRRRSLISTPGVMLFIMGFISLFWSYLMMKLYFYEDKFEGCNNRLIALLNFNSILIFIGNVPLLIVIITLVLVKVFFFLSAFLCPGILARSVKYINKDSSMRQDYMKNIED
jgi:hypothetical protein